MSLLRPSRLRVVVPAIAWTLVVGALLPACVPAAALPVVESMNDAQARARLAATGARRERMDAIVKAALPGLQGVVVNATMDVAAVAPAQFSVSVRSFFEVPQQVLVADGSTVTIYDATSGSPRFYQGPANALSLRRVLGLPLSPEDAVALMLGRAPLSAEREGWPLPRVHVIAVDGATQTYTVSIERPGRGALHWTARLKDDALVGLVVFTGDGRPLVNATLTDHRDVDGTAFAQRIAVHLEDASGGDGQEVVLRVIDGHFNGPPLPPEAFTLTPPPGVRVDPL
jgi:outer membrane lipoprotein-sorting protein